MNPNQEPIAPPPQNAYDFITNPGPPPKKSLLPGGNNLMKRVLIVVGGAVIFMILSAIIITLLTSGGQGATETMKKIVTQQQEIVFISADGALEGVDPATRSLAVTAQLSVQTDQTNIKNYLDSAGAGVDVKSLPIALDATNQTLLESAKTSNRYDETFLEILNEKLAQYQASLKNAYDSTSSEDAKSVLSDAYTSASNLLNQTATAE